MNTNKQVKIELEYEPESDGIENYSPNPPSEEKKLEIKNDINKILEILSKYNFPIQRYLINKIREKTHTNNVIEKYNNDKIVLKYHKEVDDMIWAFKQLAWRAGFTHKFENLDYYPEFQEVVFSDLEKLLSTPELFGKIEDVKS